jgi:hypothetical protein
MSRFDVTKIVAGKEPSDKFSYNNGPLVQLYVPGQSSRHTFEWVVPGKPNAMAVFLIEAFDSVESREPLDKQVQWDLVCGEDKKEGTKRPE